MTAHRFHAVQNEIPYFLPVPINAFTLPGKHGSPLQIVYVGSVSWHISIGVRKNCRHPDTPSGFPNLLLFKVRKCLFGM